jgi:hypothetical protein
MALIRTSQVVGMPVGGRQVIREDIMFNPDAVVLVRPDYFGFSCVCLDKGLNFIFPGTIDDFRALLAEAEGK